MGFLKGLLFVPIMLGADFDARLNILENQLNPHGKETFFSSVEALAWRAYENGLPIAIETENPLITRQGLPSNFASLLKDGEVKNLAFEWDAGVRAAVGYRFSNLWQLSLTGLHFFTKAHRHVEAGSGKQLQPVQLHPKAGSGAIQGEVQLPNAIVGGPFFGEAHGRWYAHLNQLDLEAARPFSVGKWLKLSPSFGMRTTWLQQRLSVDYTDDLVQTELQRGDDYDVRKKVSWWGIGPIVGVGVDFQFGKGFSLASLIAGALEIGFHRIKEVDVDATVSKNGGEGTFVNTRDHWRMTRPIVDFQLGMAWDYAFPESSMHLRLEGGWEQHIYFSQNQLPYFTHQTVVGDFITDGGDLTYQGWRCAVELDY